MIGGLYMKIKNIFSKSDISIATGLVKPKTTSLFFDKIWVPDMDNIIFDDKIPKEILYIHNFDDMDFYSLLYKYSTIGNSFHPCQDITKTLNSLTLENVGMSHDEQVIKYSNMLFMSSFRRNKSIKLFVYDMKVTHNIDITPIYIDQSSFEDDFIAKSRFSNGHPIVVAMENIPSIIEEKLDWEQVLDFKKDKQSVQNLRKFRNWVQIDMVNRTKDEIISIYEKAYDEYEQSLKKHGILTAIGTLSLVLDSSVSIIGNIGNDTYQQLATGISIATGLSVFTLTQCYSYFETKNSPIAYIYDVLKNWG